MREAAALALKERIHQAAATPRRASRKAWYEPTLADFAFGRALCFDQTVTKTGFAVVTHDASGIHIDEGNVLLAPPIEGLRGFEETLQRSVAMGRLIEAAVSMLAYGVTVIVHEMPAVKGYRIESSLMAAHSVRMAASTHARGVQVVMINKQQVAALLVSPERDRTSKNEVKRSIERLVPNWQRAPRRWTQDVSDAAGLGLTWMSKKAKESDDGSR